MKHKDSKFPFKMYAISGEGTLIPARFSETDMEIVEVTSGRVHAQVGSEYVDAERGDFMYIPHGLVFRVDATDGAASLRGIMFDVDIIANNMVNYETEILYMFYVQSENSVNVISEGHPVYKVLQRCMAESYEEYLAKDVCYKLSIRANIYLSMTALLRYYCGSKNDSDRLVYRNVLRLRPVINYISEHSEEKIYVDKLAEIIMVSPDYFTKMFKDSIGKTPIEYINGIRVNKSMQMLLEGDASIAEVAERVGFCNSNYFHKIFKQFMGVSPLAYRKENK